MGTVNDILEAIAKLPLLEQKELLKQADQKIQSAKTDAAIREAEEGKLPSFNSIDDLMADLPITQQAA